MRPGFSEAYKRELPVLQVNGTRVTPLPHDSYTVVDLEPGTHTVSLEPGTMDSRQWTASIKFDVEAPKTYFLALWMDFETRQSLTFVPMGGYVLPLSVRGPSATAVRMEFVSEQQMLPVIKGLPFMAPGVSRFSSTGR